jgi:PleD family two-component response regulator
VSRLLPLVRMHAFEARLKRMMVSLDTDGMFDPDTGLLTRDTFRRDLEKAVAEASDRSLALSLARFSFDGLSLRGGMDAARLMPRLVRNIDFATRAEDGAILVAFTQTDLRSAHVVARRLAAALKNSMLAARRRQDKLVANVTLATLNAGDTPDSLVARVVGSRAVAAE